MWKTERGEMDRASPLVFKTTKQLTRTTSASAKLDVQEETDTNALTGVRRSQRMPVISIAALDAVFAECKSKSGKDRRTRCM